MIILKHLRKLLLPIGILYGGVIFIRNRMFDWGILHQTSFTTPIIVVGNITVGGTGKTPITEYLIKHLQTHYKIALLSRGYGRKSKGAILADSNANADIIGDEPFQIKSKFPSIDLCVAEKRVEGAQLLMPRNPQLIICDDAFQHRYLKPKVAIVVVDSNRPLWKDCYLPAGELRDSPNEIKRADIVVVSKCSNSFCLSDAQMFENKLKISAKQKIFFSSIRYGVPMNLLNSKRATFTSKKVVALSGIAQPQPFFDYLEKTYSVVDKFIFPDHHNYTNADLNEIAIRLQQENEEIILLTTEKDAARLNIFPNFKYYSKIWYLPIEIEILFGEEMNFKALIESYVATNNRDIGIS